MRKSITTNASPDRPFEYLAVVIVNLRDLALGMTFLMSPACSYTQLTWLTETVGHLLEE
jgi:hypothetical protein